MKETNLHTDSQTCYPKKDNKPKWSEYKNILGLKPQANKREIHNKIQSLKQECEDGKTESCLPGKEKEICFRDEEAPNRGDYGESVGNNIYCTDVPDIGETDIEGSTEKGTSQEFCEMNVTTGEIKCDKRP